MAHKMYIDNMLSKKHVGGVMSAITKGEIFTEIVLEIFRLGGTLVAEGDEITREYGLTSARWKVLGAISLAESPLTVPQIARAMGLTRQGVQRLVDAMHKDGLLKFQENPGHKRAKLIALSSSGSKAYTKLDQKQKKWARSNSHLLNKEELQTTLSVLKRVSEQFES